MNCGSGIRIWFCSLWFVGVYLVKFKCLLQLLSNRNSHSILYYGSLKIKTEVNRGLNKLEILKKRMPLNTSESKLLFAKKTGDEGETYVSKVLSERLEVQPFVLEDFLFEIDGSECQIDFLVIFEYECLLIEVKHYEGDFLSGDEYITKVDSKKRYPNPLSQLARANDRLEKLLMRENIRMKILPLVIYTHPCFYLYNARVDSRIVFLSQLRRFVGELNQKPCRIGERHEKIFDRLNSLRLETSAYEKKIIYEYEDLKKCVTCVKCDGEMSRRNAGDRMFIYCNMCGVQEKLYDAILRNVAELEYLFPDKKLTLTLVLEWVGGCISRQFLRNILEHRYVLVRTGRTSHYVRVNEGVKI